MNRASMRPRQSSLGIVELQECSTADTGAASTYRLEGWLARPRQSSGLTAASLQ